MTDTSPKPGQRFISFRKYFPEAASIAVGIFPLLVLVVWCDVPRKIIGKGALAYAVGAVGLKLPLYHLLVAGVLHRKLSKRPLAFAQGLLSAVCELGAALGFFVIMGSNLTLAELIGFGVAAGSVEAIILPFMKNPLEGTPLEGHAEETAAKSARNTTIHWLGVLERALASIVHASSRGLTYVSYASGNPLPMIFALIGFGAIDCRAYYAHLEKWRFDDVRVLAGFYRFLGSVACGLTFLLALAYWLLVSPRIPG